MSKRFELLGRIMKRKQRKKVALVLVVFSLLCICILTYLYFTMTNYKQVKINQSNEALGIKQVEPHVPEKKIKPVQTTVVEKMEREDIVNIALFGVDRRSSKSTGRSDSIMIATIDFKHDKIKLTSLMRDLYVPIEGHGQTKLNHAYAFGGAELAIKTINQNFGTDIRDYVTVDFFTLEKIIDAIGGIEIDIKAEEVEFVNKFMVETAHIQKKSITPLVKGGLQTVNGMQAVSYARIRSLGDGDFKRTERQRIVLSAMINKVQKQGQSAIPQLFLQVTPHIETSLERSDILSLGVDYYKQQPFPVEQARFPMDGDWTSAIINKGWYMKSDMDKVKRKLQAYIYEDLQDLKGSSF